MAPSHGFGAPSCIGGGAKSQCMSYERQQTALCPRSQSPSSNTHLRQVLFIVIPVLAVIAISCILRSILRRFRPPTPRPNDTGPSPILLEPGTTLQQTLRGATRNTAQAHIVLPLVTGATDATDRATGGNADDADPIPRSSSTGGAKSARVGPGRQPGVHAASERPSACEFQNAQPPSTVDASHGFVCPHDHVSSDGLGREPCLGPAPTVESVLRGVAVNPIQIERSSIRPISACGTIEKSLFPGTLDAIESGPDDASSQALSPRPSRHVASDRTPLAVAHHLATWFIFVIAVGVDGLKDPETDLLFILGALKSTAVHIVSLLNDEATHASVQHELLQLYHQAQQHPGSRLTVYLTGHGEESGMRLFDGTTIGAEDLKRWLAKLYAQSTHSQPTLSAVFDICRPPKVFNSSFDFDLAIVWSCSVGQLAYALAFGPELPSSCFLNSLFLAAHDDLVESMGFEHAFKSRLAQQGDLLRFIHQRKHEGDKHCGRCTANDPCDPPVPQKSECSQAGRDTLLALGELIKSEFPDVAHRVHADVTRKMTCWKFLDAESHATLAPSVGYEACSTQHSSKYHRGSTGATMQATAPILTVDS